MVLAAAIPTAAAADPPILSVEPRVGRGISLGGGAGEGHVRISPMTVGVLVEYALRADPWIAAYGGPYAEVLDRGAIGVSGGVRLHPGDGWARFGLGGVGVLAPYTLAGVTASVGARVRLLGSIPVSFDVEGAAFFVGSDLPEGRVAGQIQLVVGFPLEVY